MRNIIKIFILSVLVFVTTDCLAQTAGDRLFSEGQKLQMKQTVDSQNKAIAKFNAAKKAFDSSAKKTMCDNQIAICKSNIKTIQNNKKTTQKKNVSTVKKEVEEDDSVFVEITKPLEKPVELSLSVSSLEFKAGGKKKDNHQVVVTCNYEKWTYECPKWISVTKNGNTLTLTATANEGDEERSGVFVVKCKGTRAELMVYQGNKFKIKSLFGKKK